MEQQTDVVEEQDEAFSPDVPTLEALEIERDQLIDQLQRSVADFQNYRRRNELDRLRMREIATQDVMQSILPLVDDLNRAIATVPPDQEDSALRDGLLAIARKFLAVLERYGVSPVGAVGERFDPALHEAVATDDSGDKSCVVEVFQTGYRQRDAVLRPAMVKVGAEVTFDA